MIDSNSASTPPAHNDRSGGLRIFGGLTIMLGGACGLLVLLLIWASTLGPQPAGQPQSMTNLLPGMMLYGSMAVALVWLGIGSMQARRWARALLLVLSWSALAAGIATLPMVGLATSEAMKSARASVPANQPPLPAAAVPTIVVAVVLVVGTIVVALPSIWIFFYSKRDVKLTCETRDPVVRWTDRCPLPMLAVSVWLALGAVMMLLMPFVANGVFPLFGTLVSGAAGSVVFLVLGAIYGWAARGFYQRDLRAWWVIIITIILFTISHVLTYSRVEIEELYRVMGYSADQVEQMKKYSFFSSQMMVWPMLLFLVPILGYLGWVKRFFAR